MADSQITLLPPPPIQSSTQIAHGGTSQGNPTLAAQSPGTVLQGFIINRDASGNPIVRTDSGDIPFASNFFLKIGSEVVIRVGNTAGNNSAQLLSVDGQSPEEAQNQPSYAQEPDVILAPNLSQTPTATSTSSNVAATLLAAAQEPGAPIPITVTGTVVAPPAASSASNVLPQEQTVTAGTQVTLKVISINAPGTAATTTPSANEADPQTASASYATYARAANVPPTAANTLSTSVANTTLNTPQPAAASSNGPQQIPGAPPPAATTISATTIPATSSSQATAATISQANVPTVAGNTPAIATAPIRAEPPGTAQPETAITTTNPLLQPGASVSATVLGSDSSGTLVQSSLGLVRLQTGSAIPSGSEVSFEVVQALPPAAQTAIAAAFFSPPPAPPTELAQQWSSLQQIFSLLSGRSSFAETDDTPALTANLLATQNPQAATTPSAQTITSELSSYIAALRSGDFTNWLGADKVRSLQDDGHNDLLKKVSDEFSGLARQFTQTSPNHWQALFFPLPVEGTTQQVRIFVKRDRKQGSQKKNADSEEDTRFVIEVGLSQLGELQMDGFVRKQENNTQFDMIIRSMHNLSNDIQNDILRIYNDMGAITGYSGTVSFQAVKAFPVNPMQEIAARHNAVLA